MAHLLGSKLCIDSLQKDVGDLQAVVVDIFSRTGCVSSPSWKYPEKLSCDLEINDLLDRYCYSSNEEDCQVSHIILLELVIDRLVLVIQSFSKYAEQILSIGKSASGSCKSSNSIGLIIRHYWNKMIQLHTAVKQMQKDNRIKSNELTELKDMSQSDHGSRLDDVSKMSEVSTQLKKKSLSSISVDYNCKSTQTYETSFIPCEACDGAQYCLRECGKSIADMCNSQSLPSCVWKLCQKYKDSWMSVQDMRLWLSEQNKDLGQLAIQIANLSTKLKDTEEKFDNSQMQNSKYRNDLQNLKKELKRHKDDLAITSKQYEKKLQELKDKNKETETELWRRNGELVKHEESLQIRVADLRSQLDQKCQVITSLESSRQKVLEDLARNRTDQHEIKKSQKYVEILEKELKELHGKLEESSRSVACLEVKQQSTLRQLESLKAKQLELIDQIENLERENDDLKHELADLEAEKDELAETLDSASNKLIDTESERSEFKTRIENLTHEKNELSRRVHELEDSALNLELQVQKSKEQERLLVEYPDLNGPIDYQGTGDVALDMENQIRANSIRINILQQENDSLKNSVRKILRCQTRNISPEIKAASNQKSCADPADLPKLQLWR